MDLPRFPAREAAAVSDRFVPGCVCMRVLVTGATGFVGRHVLKPLAERGFEVHTVSRRAASSEESVAHQADVLDASAVRRVIEHVRPTHLLHLAWFAEPKKFWNARENLQWVAASMEVLRAFADAGGKRFVGVGSCAEYEWRDKVYVEDRTALAPATLYGASKLAVCDVLRAFAPTVGLSFAWARLFFIYGPHEPPVKLVASVINSLLAGDTARITSGEQIRDFLHVSDAADALAAIVGSNFEGAVNIGSGNGIAVRDLVRLIGDLTGASDRVAIGAVTSAAPEAPSVVADTRRLREKLRFEPRLDLREGLEQTIAWWRANGR